MNVSVATGGPSAEETLADNNRRTQKVLDQLSMPSEAAPEGGEAPDHLSEAPRILQMALELDVVGEAVWTSLTRVVEDGRLDLLVASLDAAPRRKAPSWVITHLAFASFIRSRTASEAKPPNTTLCTAPMRAHASIAIAASGTMPM